MMVRLSIMQYCIEVAASERLAVSTLLPLADKSASELQVKDDISFALSAASKVRRNIATQATVILCMHVCIHHCILTHKMHTND